jgi:hypothetical protein
MPVTATRSLPEPFEDRVVALQAAGGLHVDVDVGQRRPALRKRSNSRRWSSGLAVAMNSAWQTMEPAPEPRAATRMPFARMSATTWPTARKYAS